MRSIRVPGSKSVRFSVDQPTETPSLPFYHISDTQLPFGSSLGNRKCWLNTEGNGLILKIYGIQTGKTVFGSAGLRYAARGFTVIEQGSGNTHPRHEEMRTRMRLRSEKPGTFTLHPGYQKHEFEFPGSIRAEETVFTPKSHEGDEDVACIISTRISNGSSDRASLTVQAFAGFMGSTRPDIVTRPDPENNALIAWNESTPGWARVFGCTEKLDGYEALLDVQYLADTLHLPKPTGRCDTKGGTTGVLEVDIEIEPGASKTLGFILAYSPSGPEDALKVYRKNLDTHDSLKRTVEYYEKKVQNSQVFTPDIIVNHGVAWAKVNMLRVMADYPEGTGFTNNPGESSVEVVRDSAWFVYGCDYFDREFSRRLVLDMARHQYENGKIPEYYDMLNGRVEDYRLNINDNTPLFIHAAAHHNAVTGDREFLHEIYPAIARASDYIISQKDDRGLVYCTATGKKTYGIAGWRNVIPGMRISGAVTEINSECYGALSMASSLAREVGKPDDRERFLAEAEKLRERINQELMNHANGMYYLNIDVDGRPHSDVTGDETFPIIFGVASDDVALNIVRRLGYSDFWTKAGIRTVSRDSVDYDPSKHVGLLGGVWPGLTFWYAFAASKFHPTVMAKGLRDSYLQYLRNPKKNNTVPGQFSEWFDGESLINKGMRLSPWEPPRLVWAAVEGMIGVKPMDGKFRLNPLIPGDWKWIGLRNLYLRKEKVSFFVAREGAKTCVYGVLSNAIVPGEIVCSYYDEDVSDKTSSLHEGVYILAFKKPDEILICAGSSVPSTITVPLNLSRIVEPGASYLVERMSSEEENWIRMELKGEAAKLRQIAFPVGRYGYQLLRLIRG